jgi:hypothetical protein
MVVFNSITGLKRKQPAYKLSRKKRWSHSSTVAGCMYSEDAIKKANLYITSTHQYVAYLAILSQHQYDPNARTLSLLCVLLAAYFFSCAGRMLELDSDLMDITDDNQDNFGYHKPLVGVTLDSFRNNDESVDKTRFTKEDIRLIVDSLSLPDNIRLYYYEENYYKFSVEELMIYMLRKFVTGRTHKDLTTEFGGCSTRWGRGYAWLVKHLDKKFSSLVGPTGMEKWVDDFPCFSEHIREYVVREKKRTKSDGTVYYLSLGDHTMNELNVMSFIDCTHYEYCRPGSGPLNSEEASPRRPGWYPKQRSFYSAYQRGMESSVKILTVLLPNGLTGAVYGPTSGRRNDLTLFRLSDLDNHLLGLCQDAHQGDMYCTYGLTGC